MSNSTDTSNGVMEPAEKVGMANAPKSNVKTRYSVRQLEELYESGKKKPMQDLMLAWKRIKELGPSELNSFFNIGGYHGEPFNEPGATNGEYWGGFCNHGNVLFPTWHRVYVLKIEAALNSMVSGVTMPYWDETSKASMAFGVPKSLTWEKFTFESEYAKKNNIQGGKKTSKGYEIDNPLRSFVLPLSIQDHVDGSNLYAKPKGYETVRYPLSGLVGTEAARKETAAHNAKFPNHKKNVKLLNRNVREWLWGGNPESTTSNRGIYQKFRDCLKAPDYTSFSNTTSASVTNGEVTPLESPHNDIHLSVGGFDVPNQGDFDQIKGANGDMGENNTAGLDPIFFFHHCNIDRMFWLWQVQNGHTNHFDIVAGNPGANTTTLNGQGPTPGFGQNQALDMDSTLNPFVYLEENDQQRYYNSKDCINIETQMGYTYSPGSLENMLEMDQASVAGNSTQKLEVSGINRSIFSGSFTISAFATLENGEEVFLGINSVLSRWNVAKCANCQAHLGVESYFKLSSLKQSDVDTAKFRVEINGRNALPEALNYDVKVID
jgi:tyrosinase